MAGLEMVQRKEHVTPDCYVNPTELVQCHAQLMEGLVMEPREVLAIKGNYVKQMEHAHQVNTGKRFFHQYQY